MPIPVKLTRAHQVTLPKRLLERAGWLSQEFFVADLKGDSLVLRPLSMENRPPLASFEDLKRHFAHMGIGQRDVHDAVKWARREEQAGHRHRKTAA